MGWQFIRIAPCLYRKVDGGTIYVRVRHHGKQVMRSTHTDNPVKAKQFLQRWHDEDRAAFYGGSLPGVQVRNKALTVSQLITIYQEAGHPNPKMKPKPAESVRREVSFLKPIGIFFGGKSPDNLTLSDCDDYYTWRLSGGYITTRYDRGKGRDRPRTIKTKGGNRAVDLELTALSNVLRFALRKNRIKRHPLMGRGRYTSEKEIRHCREVAPTPQGLKLIETWLREKEEHDTADAICFIAYSGLRLEEAMHRTWSEVNRAEGIIDCQRSKGGIFPWIPILPEMSTLLDGMKARADALLAENPGLQPSRWLFPCPHHRFKPTEQQRPRDGDSIRRRLAAACQALKIRHAAPHGLRSFFVTSARESGLTDAEIAMLIGDKSGPALIASTYGDVRPDHLIRQAQRIRFHLTGESDRSTRQTQPGTAHETC